MKRGMVGGVLVLAGVLGVPGGAAAQVPAAAGATEVFYGLGVGADIIGNSSDVNVCATASGGGERCLRITEPAGGGASLFVGLRPSEFVGVALTYDAFFHRGEDPDAYALATLQSVRADARFFLLPGSLVDPYLQAGAGLYLLGDEYDAAAAGGGFQLGGGLDVYLAPILSAGLNVLYRGIYFGEFDIARSDMPWASGDGRVQEGFLHDVTVLIDLTVHSGT
jgi:hypothetical protein